jgi:hypothetical protein
VELFDAHGVSFVSVTRQFNTTTSMGRLTLNVLLSFAQFAREVTGERIRDKIGASKRKGLWVGGMVPLGYVSWDKKLVIDEEEADRVRTIFRRYLDLFEAAQQKLAQQRNGHRAAGASSDALLTGRIFDDCGNRMSPTHSRKGAARHRYYVSSALISRDGCSPLAPLPASPPAKVEAAIVDA